MTWQQRFHAKIHFKTENECWEWTCGKDKDGYGILSIEGKKRKAHRLSMQLEGFNIDGLLVLHTCDNPACVNPNHLRLGTQKDNMQDMAVKQRGCIKLTNADVADIRTKYATGDYVLADLALEYKVTFQHISALVHKIKRKAI